MGAGSRKNPRAEQRKMEVLLMNSRENLPMMLSANDIQTMGFTRMVVNSNRSVYQSDVRELKKQFSELSEKLNEHLKPLSYEVL